MTKTFKSVWHSGKSRFMAAFLSLLMFVGYFGAPVQVNAASKVVKLSNMSMTDEFVLKNYKMSSNETTWTFYSLWPKTDEVVNYLDSTHSKYNSGALYDDSTLKIGDIGPMDAWVCSGSLYAEKVESYANRYFNTYKTKNMVCLVVKCNGTPTDGYTLYGYGICDVPYTAVAKYSQYLNTSNLKNAKVTLSTTAGTVNNTYITNVPENATVTVKVSPNTGYTLSADKITATVLGATISDPTPDGNGNIIFTVTNFKSSTTIYVKGSADPIPAGQLDDFTITANDEGYEFKNYSDGSNCVYYALYPDTDAFTEFLNNTVANYKKGDEISNYIEIGGKNVSLKGYVGTVSKKNFEEYADNAIESYGGTKLKCIVYNCSYYGDLSSYGVCDVPYNYIPKHDVVISDEYLRNVSASISASAGTVQGNRVYKLPEGESITVTLTPYEDYMIDADSITFRSGSFKVSDPTVNDDGSVTYTISNVTDDATIYIECTAERFPAEKLNDFKVTTDGESYKFENYSDGSDYVYYLIYPDTYALEDYLNNVAANYKNGDYISSYVEIGGYNVSLKKYDGSITKEDLEEYADNAIESYGGTKVKCIVYNCSYYGDLTSYGVCDVPYAYIPKHDVTFYDYNVSHAKLSISAAAGRVDGNTVYKLPENESVTVTITPDEDYKIKADDIKFDGENITVSAPTVNSNGSITYTVSNFKSNAIVNVTAAAKEKYPQCSLVIAKNTTYAVDYSFYTADGTPITDSTIVKVGDKVTVVVKPSADNYQFAEGYAPKLVYNGKEVTAVVKDGAYEYTVEIAEAEEDNREAYFEISGAAIPEGSKIVKASSLKDGEKYVGSDYVINDLDTAVSFTVSGSEIVIEPNDCHIINETYKDSEFVYSSENNEFKRVFAHPEFTEEKYSAKRAEGYADDEIVINAYLNCTEDSVVDIALSGEGEYFTLADGVLSDEGITYNSGVNAIPVYVKAELPVGTYEAVITATSDYGTSSTTVSFIVVKAIKLSELVEGTPVSVGDILYNDADKTAHIKLGETVIDVETNEDITISDMYENYIITYTGSVTDEETGETTYNFMVVEKEVPPEEPVIDPFKYSDPLIPSYYNGSDNTLAPKAPAPTTSNGRESGWKNVIKRIGKTDEGKTVTINMNGVTEIPTEVIKAAIDNKVDLKVKLDKEIIWTIDIDSLDEGAVDLGAELVKITKDDAQNVTITLISGKKAAFNGTVTVKLGAANNGKYANMYYVNDNGERVLVDSAKIVNGFTTLVVPNASEFIIVISDKPLTK